MLKINTITWRTAGALEGGAMGVLLPAALASHSDQVIQTK